MIKKLGTILLLCLAFLNASCFRPQEIKSPLSEFTSDKTYFINTRIIWVKEPDAQELESVRRNLDLSEYFLEPIHIKFVITSIDKFNGIELNGICSQDWNPSSLGFESLNHMNTMNIYLCPRWIGYLGYAHVPESGLSCIELFGYGIYREDTLIHEIGHGLGGLDHSWIKDIEITDISPTTIGDQTNINMMSYSWMPEKISLGEKSFSKDQLTKFKRNLLKYSKEKFLN